MSSNFSNKNLPIHFFTIVLNGEPFIRYHLEAFKDLPFPWHWHVVEGVAKLVHDTAWSVAAGGTINSSLHFQGRSNDGTSEYLDQIASEYPQNISIYRKPAGNYWEGKLEMVSAPLVNLPEHCFLWQIDVDELWSQAQITKTRELFLAEPEKTAAWFWCHFFVGPNLVVNSRNCYGNHSQYEWQRVWRYRTGMYWASHEPPKLLEKRLSGRDRDVGIINPFLHYEMERYDLIFQHFAYVLPQQLKFKETYYGYKNAVIEWQKLQMSSDRPLFLKNYFSWVKDNATINSAAALSVSPIAQINSESGSCQFLAQNQIKPYHPRLFKVGPRIAIERPGFYLAQLWNRIVTHIKSWNAFFARSARFFSQYMSLWHLKSFLTLIFVDVFLMFFVHRRQTNAVFVLKLDRLGDYILCRNFLRLIRTYPPYQSRKVFLCANINLKELIETYDADSFDSFIWVDHARLTNQAWYRFTILRKIKKLGAQIAIHPTYAREAYIGDCLMWATGASERIGRESYPNLDPARSHLKRHHATRADFFYTRLVPEDHRIIFDFYRYQSFFSTLLPGLEMPQNTRLTPLPVAVPKIKGPFAVIMPGANQVFREWPADRFAQVARLLFSIYGLRSIILGASVDQPKAAAMQQAAPEIPMENLCGDLSLPQIVYLMSQCTVGITNESGGIHLLAALDKPGVAIANGNRFGWFHPYPNELSTSVSFVYPPAFYAQSLNEDQRKEFYRGSRYHPIQDVLPETVIERVAAVVKESSFHDPIQETCN